MAGRDNLTPFKKGPDPRRNRKGRPKNIPGLRELVQSILHEVATDKSGNPIVINGHAATVIEAKIRQLIQSKNSRDTQIVFDYAFGKVPNAVELSGKDGGPISINMTWSENDVNDDND